MMVARRYLVAGLLAFVLVIGRIKSGWPMYWKAVIEDFHLVVDQVGQLEALLEKGLVSGSPQQIFLLTEIWRNNAAQSALGQLPYRIEPAS